MTKSGWMTSPYICPFSVAWCLLATEAPVPPCCAGGAYPLAPPTPRGARRERGMGRGESVTATLDPYPGETTEGQRSAVTSFSLHHINYNP